MNKSQVINFFIEVVVTDRFHCISCIVSPLVHDMVLGKKNRTSPMLQASLTHNVRISFSGCIAPIAVVMPEAHTSLNELQINSLPQYGFTPGHSPYDLDAALLITLGLWKCAAFQRHPFRHEKVIFLKNGTVSLWSSLEHMSSAAFRFLWSAKPLEQRNSNFRWCHDSWNRPFVHELRFWLTADVVMHCMILPTVIKKTRQMLVTVI